MLYSLKFKKSNKSILMNTYKQERNLSRKSWFLAMCFMKKNCKLYAYVEAVQRAPCTLIYVSTYRARINAEQTIWRLNRLLKKELSILTLF